MSKKAAVGALLAALLAFGYIFTLNPVLVDFQLLPQGWLGVDEYYKVKGSFALILFLFFLAGFGIAMFGTAFVEAWRSLLFWRQRKAWARREEAKQLVLRGREGVVKGDTKRALRFLRQAHRKAGDDVLTTLEMARVEIADGQLDRAEQRLKNLLPDNPRSPEILSLLLAVYRQKGDFEGQVAALRVWLDADPNHLPTLRSLRDVYRKTENWSEAARVQERIAERVRGRPREERQTERRILSELRLLHSRATAPAARRELLERLVKEDETFAPAHAALGDTLLALGQREEAAQAWLKGFNASNQPGLLLKAEAIRSEDGKADEMLRHYKKVAKKNAVATLLRARLLLSQERSKEALEVLDGAAEDERNSAWGLRLRGEALYRLQSYEEAAKMLRASVGFGDDTLPVEYRCAACGASAGDWRDTCVSCGVLGRLEADLRTAAAGLPALV